MLLGLHLVTLTHGQQSVKVLGLGAYVVQQTGCKCFWVLKTENVKHIIALQKVYSLFYTENKPQRLLNVKKYFKLNGFLVNATVKIHSYNEYSCSCFILYKNPLVDRRLIRHGK